MLSTLFGKKVAEPSKKPWDVLKSGEVNLPIWRAETKDRRVRFVFGFSRPVESNGETYYARTFGAEHFWDLIKVLEVFALNMAGRRDVSHQDRQILMAAQAALEQALAVRQPTHSGLGNGHGEPTR